METKPLEQARRRQGTIEFLPYGWLGVLAVNLVAAASNVAFCILDGVELQWIPALVNAWAAAAAVSGWRGSRKFAAARRAFLSDMNGLVESHKSGRMTALEHYDDQTNASLSRMQQINETASPFYFKLRGN